MTKDKPKYDNISNPMDSMDSMQKRFDRQKEEMFASLASITNDIERPAHPGVMTNKLLVGTVKLMDERLSAIESAVKKPHWSVVPSFWLLVFTVVLAILGIFVTLVVASVEPSQLKQLVHLGQLFPQKQPPSAEQAQYQQPSASTLGETPVSTTKK